MTDLNEIKITGVKAFTVYAEFPFKDEKYMEERLVRPIDIYPEYFKTGPQPTKKVSKETMEITRSFMEISTDAEISGLTQIIPQSWSIIKNSLSPIILGKDVLSIEKIWDQMFRIQVHGRKCQTMIAISAVDNCLWDIIGKYRKEPIHRLLGGPVKEKIRAYASMLGHSIEPKLLAERAQKMVDTGYTAQKWFFRYGPSKGIKGVRKNIELAKTFRDAVGYESDLMLDTWMSWSIPYTIKMAKKLERYEPSWIEEPLLPDQIDGYAEIRANIDIPLSGAEHEYTRWGFIEYLKKKALDIWQPDINWAGGVSEVKKICTLGSSVGIPIVPHSGNARMSSPIWFSHNVETCPLAEYLVKHNALAQYVYKKPLTPIKGYIPAPKEPGLGIELDDNKIVKKESLN
jgi:L-alanine-DL-glutamate epimerase-like enolase superfamily enzyme